MPMASNQTIPDVIIAPATPTGHSGLAVIRISGNGAAALVASVFRPRGLADGWEPNRSYLGWLHDPATGEALAEIRMTFFRGPHSYTGEDLIEITSHGNPYLVERIITLFLECGARLAQPGEFTRRALISGKLDLLQAEAVADTIYAVGDEARRMAVSQYEGNLSAVIRDLQNGIADVTARVEAIIDFPEEEDTILDQEQCSQQLRELHARMTDLLKGADVGHKIRAGYQVLILGRANVGKSTLFNRLLGYDRALVHETPGTTRDHIEETIRCGGLCLHLTDTAGLLQAAGGADRMAAERTKQMTPVADLLVLVFDGSEPLSEADIKLSEMTVGGNRIFVVNKIDLNQRLGQSDLLADAVKVSAKTGEHIDLLTAAIIKRLTPSRPKGQPLLNRIRHVQSVQAALGNMDRAMDAIQQTELLAFELHEAMDHLGEVTGQILRQEILERIFSEFCIGK